MTQGPTPPLIRGGREGVPTVVTQHNYDIICLSETFQISSIDISDTSLSIDGYNLIRSDHPSDSKRGGFVFIIKNTFL